MAKTKTDAEASRAAEDARFARALRIHRGGWQGVPDADCAAYFRSLDPALQAHYLSPIATSPADAAAKAII